jgi:transcriptional regulator with XRE-family HTH domain
MPVFSSTGLSVGYRMALGTRISERLKALKMNQSQLARRCGIPQTTVNSIIKEDRRSSPHLMKFAAALRTTPAYLLSETEDPDSQTASAAITFEEQELIELTRMLEREDYNIVRHLIRRLASGTPPNFKGAVNDADATQHDRQIGYRSR